MWTPYFPLLPDGQKGIEPPAALDVVHVVDGSDVVLTISLRYGSRHERRVPVTKIRLTPDLPIAVNDLIAFGVAPVTFAIIPIPDTLTHEPTVVAASGSLDVRVEPIAPNIPAYRVIVTNDSQHALMAIQFEAFEGERRRFGGRKRGERNLPLAEAKGKYVFELPMDNVVKAGATSTEGWKVLDLVVVTSVIWADGVVEGDPGPAAQERAINDARAQQLARVLPLLTRARNATPAALRRQIAGLSVESGAGMQQVKDALLADLNDFERTTVGRPRSFDDWIIKTIQDYEQWKARIVNAVGPMNGGRITMASAPVFAS